MILKRNDKTKKIDLSNFFKEEAFLTIKYINREVWRYINRLTLKTAEASFYVDITNSKEYKEIENKIKIAKTQKEKEALRIELQNKANELLALKYQGVKKELLDETFKIETEKNKMLIEYGIIKDSEHNFTDEKNNKLVLDYDLLKDCVFFDYLIQEIIKFNSEFDAGETR